MIFLGFSSYAFATESVGFIQGSQFQVAQLYGELIVYCPGSNPATNKLSCLKDQLSPSEYDYFVGPKITGATTVRLSNQNGNTQKSGYDASSGKSKRMFNLWNKTLLQKPLLKLGANTIFFELLDDENRVLKVGQFSVDLINVNSRVCPQGQTVSNWPEDCESNNYQLCAGYFREYKFCQN
jgi:hypothetical protein